ncbi:MAG: hypothetical protein L3J09_10110 [Flavobacteriaceae bacterium]|nr:hypothetical protein [Flavobacteriaceae bacterium]
MKKQIIILLLLVSGFTYVNAQELKVESSSSVNIEQLPEYVVITSENTKLLGGINITIDYKKSDYADVLEELEILLQNRKKLRIRNQTDLLNTMSKLGFEYIDAFNASAGTLGAGGGDDVIISGSSSKFRINIVFRKKEKFINK